MSIISNRPGSGSGFATPTGVENLTNKHISSTSLLTGALTLPAGSVAQRPTPEAGMTRLNTDSNSFEGYANGIWSSIGGGLNEFPAKNYLKTYAEGNVSPGTVSTTGSTGSISIMTAWYADVTSGASAVTSPASTALRGSNNYLPALSGNANNGATFFQFPAMTLEATDVGKPISISFDVTGNTTSGDWDVVIAQYNSSGTYIGLIPVAGTASASSVTPSALLPTGTSNFQGFFIAGSTATDVYALRFRRLAGAVSPRIDTIYVGPQSVVQGAAVTDWKLYDPGATNVVGFGTITSYGFYWKQIGDTLHVRGKFVAGTTTATEARIPFPNSVVSSSNLTLEAAGYYYRNAITAYNQQIYREVGVSYFTMGRADGTLAGFTKQNASSLASASDVISFEASCPISTWSSNVTMANRAVEEYAYNTGVTDANDTTSFGYGSVGVQFGSYSTATRTKRVRFQTPIQKTDLIEIELWDNAAWVTQGFVTQCIAAATGMTWGPVSGSTTDIDVFFGASGYSATPRTSAGAWSTIAASVNYMWRVRKVSGGASVGYPIGARNVVGDTTGTAVPAGYIGETIESSITQTTITTSITDVTSSSLPLTPGKWEITYSANVNMTTGASASNSTSAYIWIADSSNNLIAKSPRVTTCKTVAAVANTFDGVMSASVIVNLSAATTYKLRGQRVDLAGTGTYVVLQNNGLFYETHFYAKRVA
jgi:hypothetical protein